MMKKNVLAQFMISMWTCLILAIPARAQTQTTTPVTLGDTTVMALTDIIATGLPTMVVETIDHEEPTCDYVYAPAGCMGASITNATKVPGRLMIYQRLNGVDSVLYDSGEYEESASGMTIKIRGNTSAFEAKKPYKIKLQKKKDLLFRGDEATFKDKEWLLLKDDRMLTTAGFKVSELAHMIWVPGHQFVNVIINNDYRGVYLLCEAVKRNPDCRLNVDKNTGYIFECDPYWWNEDVYVNSITSPRYNFTFKYPDSDEITAEQLEYIQGVVTQYENSLTTNYYPQYLDVESFAAWCLVHDIMGTTDSGGANRYYTKYDNSDTSKIFMPVAWDFDMAERSGSDWSKCHTSHMSKLFENNNHLFVDAFVGLWRKINITLINDFSQYFTDFQNSSQGAALNASYQLNEIVWGTNLTVPSLVSSRKRWINKRYIWLFTQINALNPRGDTNINGVVNISDVTYLINTLLTDEVEYPYACDVNGDGAINIGDVTYLINLLLVIE